MLVADLMTRNTLSIREDQTLADAAQLMWQHDCGAVPVVQDGSRVVGMLTDRDICMATWSRGLPPASIAVVGAMSEDVVHCSENDSVGHAESIMQSNQVRRLPVLDGEDRLVGILSLADIARASQSVRRTVDHNEDGVAKTLAGICKAHVTARALRSDAAP